jgi:hypothetical protein
MKGLLICVRNSIKELLGPSTRFQFGRTLSQTSVAADVIEASRNKLAKQIALKFACISISSKQKSRLGCPKRLFKT